MVPLCVFILRFLGLFVIFGALYLKFTLLFGLFLTTCSRGIFLGESTTLLFTQVPGGGGTWSWPNEDFTMEKLLFGGGGGGGTAVSKVIGRAEVAVGFGGGGGGSSNVSMVTGKAGIVVGFGGCGGGGGGRRALKVIGKIGLGVDV